MTDRPQVFGVWCTVWGGLTGYREGWLKLDGVVQRFATRNEADAECDRCLARLAPHRTAEFSYTVRVLRP